MFTTEECQSLSEYVRVMAPIAVNLDILQGDRESYLGSLVPHIVHLKDQLTDLRDGKRGPPLKYTMELLEVVLGKLLASNRFGPMLDNLDYQLAACFHPAYKLNWIKFWDPEKYDGIRNNMITMVAKEIRDQAPEQHSRSRPVTAEMKSRTEPATASISRSMQLMPVCDDDVIDDDVIDDDVADNYCSLTQLYNKINQETAQEEAPKRSAIEKARDFVDMWENTPATENLKDDASFLDSPVMIELFIATNTGVVSSAACERFFSQGKDTLRAKRETMSPNLFESVMFLRGNGHLWAVPKCRKNRERFKRKPHKVLEYWANEKC
jgi:hypothetical protein